jgi:hypothetical protein
MRLLIALLLLSPASCATTAQPKVDWVRLVDCIAQVENGTPWKPGGVLCWTKAAWEEETNLPYEYSIDYSISRVLAISRLSRQAVSNHRTTINEIASLWNRGPNGPRTSNYGQRVANLYLDTP